MECKLLSVSYTWVVWINEWVKGVDLGRGVDCVHGLLEIRLQTSLRFLCDQALSIVALI